VIRPQANLVFIIGLSFFREILLRGKIGAGFGFKSIGGPPIVNRNVLGLVERLVTKLLPIALVQRGGAGIERLLTAWHLFVFAKNVLRGFGQIVADVENEVALKTVLLLILT